MACNGQCSPVSDTRMSGHTHSEDAAELVVMTQWRTCLSFQVSHTTKSRVGGTRDRRFPWRLDSEVPLVSRIAGSTLTGVRTSRSLTPYRVNHFF